MGAVQMQRAVMMAAIVMAASPVGYAGPNTPAERGGVLFYAGFDGSRNADANGKGTATLVAGGGKLTADSFDSVRGGALETGDGVGYVEFSAKGNILPDEGTIEMWIKSGGWSSDDKQQHIFFQVDGQGKILFYKRADAVNSFMVRGPIVKDSNDSDGKYQGVVQTGYVCQQLKDRWTHYFLIWKRGELIAYYRGGTRFDGADRTQHFMLEHPLRASWP